VPKHNKRDNNGKKSAATDDAAKQPPKPDDDDAKQSPKKEAMPTPSPEEPPSPESLKRAEECFDRAQQATVRSNYDYAIALFLEGLRYNPLDVERGHRGLRDAAIRRRSQGKGAGLGSVFSQGKAAFSQMLGRKKDAMLALEAAMAKDPANVMILTQLMQMARRLDYSDLAIWFGELASEESLRGKKKPQKQIFTTLGDLYKARGRFREAIEALQEAVKIDPSDRTLDKEMRDLAAASSIQESKLDSVSDFHQMIRDRATASDAATQKVVRTQEQLDAQYEELKAALDADPENPIKMQNLADCQWRRGFTDEAMSLLKKALAVSGEYRFKMRMDDIQMSEQRTRLREVAAQLEAEPDRADLKAKHQQLLNDRDAFEIQVFQEQHKQYPTDLGIRFELGLRQYQTNQLDEAIVSFQQATRDPKRRIRAFNMLGRCFFAKKLYEEAQGQFQTAIQQYDFTGDPLAKELRYNLALSLEALDKPKEAIEWYSDIVQQDYQYRDAAKRLERLRRRSSGETPQP